MGLGSDDREEMRTYESDGLMVESAFKIRGCTYGSS